ncbi:inositol 1,4,5-triphosphate receptor associated 2 isoform X1 [Pogona vitticeps]
MSKMASESYLRKRHHHPVDSLCRKLQAINMMDQASNPALQIPKFQSKNFDSPQSNVKKNLEEILKKRTLKTSEDTSTPSNSTCLLSPFVEDSIFSPCPPVTTPAHRRVSDIRSESFLSGRNKEKATRSWLLASQTGCSSPYLVKREGSASAPRCGPSNRELKSVPSRECNYLTSSPDVSAQETQSAEAESQLSSSKTLSMGWKRSTEIKDDEDSDVSLICEEDLLTTMFSACDVERRGKVPVSKLVDFLRYTTSRSSEDSGLEELCNMLDPDQRDISMDLETYHAIMKEWIEDCRRNWNDFPATEMTKEGTPVAKKTPMRMNVTFGSLEALGGDVSRGDLEASDLITCVADLQFNNQKLQEENSQLKLALDVMEETNNRLTEDNGDLRNQIKSFQQSVARVKTLKEELEEAKNSLNTSEEQRLKVEAQNKQLEKENQILVLKISSLQEENIRNALDSDGLEKKIVELSRNIAELHVQVHLYENMMGSKDAALQKKDLDIQEMKSTLKEYTSVIEILRIEKNKLMNNVQHMQQELISNGINFPLIYKLNSSILDGTNSLHWELELAQRQPEVSGTERCALDESLDREVLLLLEGPERVGENFKAIVQKLQEDFLQVDELASLTLLWPADSETNMQEAYEKKLVDLGHKLEKKRTFWIQKLDLLGAQKESLDKELIKMSGSVRRLRTEQLHLKKALSSRQHELESIERLKEDAVAEAEVLRSTLQEADKKLEDANQMVKDREKDFHVACEEARSLQKKLEETLAEQAGLREANSKLTLTCQLLERKAKDCSSALDSLREKCFKGLSHGVVCQVAGCSQRLGAHENQLFSLSSSTTSGFLCSQNTLLLDALALDSLHLIQRGSVPSYLENTKTKSVFKKRQRRNETLSDVMLEVHKCNRRSVGNQTDPDFALDTRMEVSLTEEGETGLLADVTSSSEPKPSQEATSGPPSECTKGFQVIGMDSVPPQTMEGEVSESASVMVEEEAVVAAGEEPKEGTLSTVAAGDSSSTENLSRVAVCRSRQKSNASPSEKETEAEFLRLSLGFKCDLFTLEKRVRLEERSRDLAEGNLRKETAGALKLLDSLAALSEDNQAQEIVKKLRKSLDLLNQHATRIASKAEMLGAVHQESRVSKAVEVMIQHVENLKRTYAREHAELEELKGILLQNEKSFGSLCDRDESSIKKHPGSLKAQLNETDGSDRNDKFCRRSSWGLLGAKQGEKRPLLHRYVSSPSWTESEEDQLGPEITPLEQPAPEIQGSKARKLSEKEGGPSKWGLHSLCTRLFSWTSSLGTSFCRANKAVYASVIVTVLLAVLSTFLMGFSFQRPAEAAPAGTGDAWTSVQQLLWPYTGLQHQGPPPV